MKKLLSVSLATVLVVSTLPSTLFAATAGPDEVSNVKPADFAKNVSRNAVLEAVIKDPSNSVLKSVDFMEGVTYDFSSGNGVSGFYGTSATDPLTLPAGGTAFTDANKKDAASADQKYATTDGQNTYPFHRFEVDVSKHLAAGNEIELHWQGKTLAQGKLILSAWDNSANKWVVLEEKAASGNGNIVFSKTVSDSKFFKNGKMQAMVHDASPAPQTGGGDSGDDEKFTMLWFTDTQFYAANQPEVWESMTDWMVKSYNEDLYEYAIFSGDMVDKSDDMAQWEVANENFNRMDAANIPYGVLAGNRDVVIQGVTPETLDYTNYGTYAGSSRFAGKPWYVEQMDNNRNHYDLFSFGEHDFIILYLGYGRVQENETINWANAALKKHADKNAIVVAHNYLSPGGYRSKDGDYLYNNVVRPNLNVKMVLGGHYFGADRAVRTPTYSDGSTREILEVLSNYQGEEGAEGYLRLLTFDPATDTIDFKTYSPYHDDYNYFEGDKDEFTANYVLAPTGGTETPPASAVRQIATDYVAVNVYTDDVIGSVKNLPSGSKASVEWKELAALTEYFWYVKITNSANAAKTSKIYRFTTNDAALPEPEEPTDPEEPGEPEEPTDPEEPEEPGEPEDPIKSTFPDILNTKYEWALEAIEAIYARQIITGHEDGTFKPGDSIERQHVALMFTRAIDLNKVVPMSPFIDVPKSLKYYKEIMEVQQAGIVEGYENKFRPAGKMTRAEMAKVLVVAFDIDVKGSHPFTDVPANHWASKFVGPLYQAGITIGTGKTKFDLESEVTRAEFATFMYRALKYKEKNQ